MGRFLEMVGWGGQLGGIQNQPGGFDEKRLVTLVKLQIFIQFFIFQLLLTNEFVKNFDAQQRTIHATTSILEMETSK